MSDSNPAPVTSEIAVAALDDDAPQRRGGRFKPRNPGKPKGARHKTTLAIEALLEGEAEALTRKAIELAKAGDLVALRLCLDRICPPRKDGPVPFALPELRTAEDAKLAASALLEGGCRWRSHPKSVGCSTATRVFWSARSSKKG